MELIGEIRAGDKNLDSSVSDGIKPMGIEETEKFDSINTLSFIWESNKRVKPVRRPRSGSQ